MDQDVAVDGLATLARKPIRSGADYVASLRGRKLKVYLMGALPVHMWRNVYELAAPLIASEAPEQIAGFYAIERKIRGCSVEDHRLMRQQKSRPLADASKA